MVRVVYMTSDKIILICVRKFDTRNFYGSGNFNKRHLSPGSFLLTESRVGFSFFIFVYVRRNNDYNKIEEDVIYKRYFVLKTEEMRHFFKY